MAVHVRRALVTRGLDTVAYRRALGLPRKRWNNLNSGYCRWSNREIVATLAYINGIVRRELRATRREIVDPGTSLAPDDKVHSLTAITEAA